MEFIISGHSHPSVDSACPKYCSMACETAYFLLFLQKEADMRRMNTTLRDDPVFISCLL